MGDDNWAIYSEDGSLTAHFEHTIAVTAEGPRILTPWHLEERKSSGLTAAGDAACQGLRWRRKNPLLASHGSGAAALAVGCALLGLAGPSPGAGRAFSSNERANP